MKIIAAARVTSTPTPYQQHIETSEEPLSEAPSATRFSFIADEPASAGGADSGPAPFQLYLAGLGACTSMTLQMYAERKGWELGTVRVDLALRRNREGETEITRDISVSAELTDDQWSRLLTIAGKTPVTLVVKQGATLTDRRR